MNFHRKIIIIVVLVITGIVVGVSSKHSSHQKKPSATSVLVQVKPVVTQPMPINLTGVGSIEPQQSVAVTAQISGILKKIAFQPGAQIKAGQLLFEIDPASVATTLQQTQAIIQRDQADLAAKDADARRFAALVKLGYVTQQQYDQAKAAANAEAAVVVADEAQMHQAQIQLGYTQIRAPVAGKTGNMTVKTGDLINANNATPLVTINQLKPILVDFHINQNQLLRLLSYQHQKPLTVEVYSEDSKKLLDKGQLTFIDNTIDKETDSVLLKATMPNSNLWLWPGMIVNVKLILTIQQDAVVIPIKAVQFDEQGAFVYLADHGKAILQRVIIDRQNKKLAVIQKGVHAGEKVITEAPPDLTAGALIRIVN
jgi:multidrug efflux system membrane fusion protein